MDGIKFYISVDNVYFSCYPQFQEGGVSLEINHRIFDLRKEVGLNQFEFGKRIGVTRSAICNYENGSRQQNAPACSRTRGEREGG